MRRALSLVVALVLLAGVAGCSGDDDSSGGAAKGGDGESADGGTNETPAVAAEEYTGDDFYTPPDPLPAGEHGTLLRYQPLDDFTVEGATGWRVMYLSESVPGDPIAVTGTVVIPTGEAPAEGRKLVTIAHGTSGIADECAPSRNAGASEASLASGSFAQAGYVVAVSDYEGLGTPGRHPYLVGESEGRSVLDAATAAEQLPDAAVGDRYAIIGYSQGGHGALFAGQLAEDWGPDLELVGTVAGAPATELSAILAAGGSGVVAGFAMMIVGGFEAAYPDADLTTLLSPAGVATLPDVDKGCVGEVIAAVASHAAEQLFQPDHTSAEPWADLAEENTPGHVITDTPILILHSAADDLVPVVLSQVLFDRLCEGGQTVERRVYELGKGHGAAAVDAYADGFTWIESLMTGTAEAKSTCP
jgi:dienelactone hydrolase